VFCRAIANLDDALGIEPLEFARRAAGKFAQIAERPGPSVEQVAIRPKLQNLIRLWN
jgi:hypothetical protein